MKNSPSSEDAIKTLSAEVIHHCQPGFDMNEMNGLVDSLFTNAKALAKEDAPDVDQAASHMIADKLVVNSLINQLYFLDTSEVQVFCLRQIASQNETLRNAFEFIQAQNNYIPVEDRSEEDEKIQGFVNAILKQH